MGFRLPLHWVCDFSTEVAGLPLGIETKILPPGRLQCKARPQGTAKSMSIASTHFSPKHLTGAAFVVL